MGDAKRRVWYVSGTRADFGLVASTLQRLHRRGDVKVGVLLTGMHLSPLYGDTAREVEASALPIVARVPVDVASRTGLGMATAVGQGVLGMAEALAQGRPDLLLLLGDRGEMLAGAIAALHLGVPVAHLHGGERSGTVDEPVRHAITKLSHLHLVATDESRERVVRMGEDPARVHVVGAPGLDDILQGTRAPPHEVRTRLGLAADSTYVLVLFHPVVQEAGGAAAQAQALWEAVRGVADERGMAVVWLAPNSDAGSAGILETARAVGARVLTHLARADYLDALSAAAVLVGNSSSGVIEAASFGTPVVNVGSRQRLRQRNANTVDCEPTGSDIGAAIRFALYRGRLPPSNVYGDGGAGARIADLLATVPLPPSVLDKVNAY